MKTSWKATDNQEYPEQLAAIIRLSENLFGIMRRSKKNSIHFGRLPHTYEREQASCTRRLNKFHGWMLLLYTLHI